MVLLAILSLIAFLSLGSIVYNHYFVKKYAPPGTRRLLGPRGVPILGSVGELPPKHPWLKFFDWSRQYGEIYGCTLAGTHIAVMSSPRIAEDLLVHRSDIFSSRPKLPAIIPDSRTSMHYIALMSEGSAHKRGRRFVKHMVSNTPRNLIVQLTEKSSAALALQLIDNPSNWQVSTEVHAGHVTAQVAWGDSSFKTAETSVWDSNSLIPKISFDGAIENKLPFLTKLPNWIPLYLQPWKRNELFRYSKERNFWLGQMERVKSGALKGSSWAERWLFSPEEREHGITSEEEAAYAIGFLAMIGSVLLSSPLQTLYLALILHPEWQKKAQDQIAAVCGDQVPRDSDMQNLPIVRALLRESMRWRPSVPLGVPHVSEEDYVYNGWYIPKGTICLASEWALTRDEILYPDPESFRPDRWLDPNFPTYKEPLTHHPEIKGTSAFGWGGRTCPGAHYTEVALFTMASTILWSCTLTKARDPRTGEELEVPWMDFGPPNAIVKPRWFPINVFARSEEKVAWLKLYEGRDC